MTTRGMTTRGPWNRPAGDHPLQWTQPDDAPSLASDRRATSWATLLEHLIERFPLDGRVGAAHGEKDRRQLALGISPETEDVIKEAAMSDMLEIEAQRSRSRKASDGETFAGQMITDHTKTRS